MTELRLKDFQVILNSQPLCSPMSIQIGMGNFVAIIGNNGSGKTSLLNALYGEMPHIGFASTLGKSFFYLRQHQHLAFDLSVVDILTAALHNNPNYGNQKAKEASALAILQEWGISSLIDKTFFQLSGGQRQLVWILQALIGKPKTLLLDEPTQYLDIKNTKLFYDKLFTYAKANNSLILCVSHEIEKLEGREGLLLNIENPVIATEKITDKSIAENLAKLS